ncbi:MAG: GNAT family N-acetyltransferase [Proteobacteria bacterium]|nr:GNAT family N-acetyltransferase [Pseudomonadota bacterium]
MPSAATPSSAVSIVRLTQLGDWRHRATELDPIFFEASLTKSFADDAARSAFRDRWLGRYVEHMPDLAHLAVSRDGRLIGYIVGSHRDPARDPMFADIGFYSRLGQLSARFPAHLHINMAEAARGLGIGSQLIAAFEADARAAGLPGLHLVTGRDSRNRSFYAKNGFACMAELDWGGTPIVFLGKVISAQAV